MTSTTCQYLTARVMDTPRGPVLVHGYPCGQAPAPYGPGECAAHLDQAAWGIEHPPPGA